MNDELRHANNYKYIKREWKNGKWQYTYEDSKGVKGKSSANPLGVRDLRNKSGKMNIQKKKLVEITNQIGYNNWKGRNEYQNVYNLGTGDRGISGKDKKGFNMIENADGTTKKIKTTGRVRKDGPDDQNAAAKATKQFNEAKEVQKNSKSAMQRGGSNKSTKNDEPKRLNTSEVRERPDKWLDSETKITIYGGGKKGTHTIHNKGKITLATEAAKQKIVDLKTSAKESISKGDDWIKDKLGYDEKERYEQKLKEKKALKEIREITKLGLK